jgi:small subunit ribosomal protein S17
VERRYFHFIPKYERYERRHSRIAAYNPECISAKEGDKVKIVECRPLSKTKAFAIIEVIK